MYTFILVVHVFIAIALIGLILIQHGKGADAGAAFGAGASGTVFGARGAANFLTRLTGGLAAGFVATSLALAHFVKEQAPESIFVEPEAVVETMEATPTLDDINNQVSTEELTVTPVEEAGEPTESQQ